MILKSLIIGQTLKHCCFATYWLGDGLICDHFVPGLRRNDEIGLSSKYPQTLVHFLSAKQLFKLAPILFIERRFNHQNAIHLG
jgi:hypothetical protein